MSLDPRLNAYRPDLADARLEGQVTADRFSAGETCRITSPRAAVMARPSHDAGMVTEALFGETVQTFDRADGWAWGQLAGDGYVGYIAEDALAQSGAPATHYVSVPATVSYPRADLKSTPAHPLYLMSPLTIVGLNGEYAETDGGRFVFARHIRAMGDCADDPASIAARFEHVPYLWGGKTHRGLDCSGLVQLAWQATGRACPRDSDMINARIGEDLPGPDRPALRRNDLVFWRGHVGLMLDEKMMIHANGHHMAVAIEPLSEAVERIARLYGPVTGYKRPDSFGRAAG